MLISHLRGIKKEALNMSFDRLRTNGRLLIPVVVSPSAQLRTGLSNHERNLLAQCFLNRP